MARLPVPGSDDGTWGDILNDFLSQSHNPDGTLQAGAIPDGSVTPAKLSQSYLPSSQKGAANGLATLDATGKVPSAQLPATSTPDATTATKGVVQLAGDLGGTADAPTVPGLAGKANTSHTHAITDTTGLQAALDGKADETVTVSGSTSLTGGGDLTANRTISLVGDAATPGNSRYYGTDGAGAKGFHPLPAGDPTMGGDLTGTASNAQIAAGAVGPNELANDSVTEPKLDAANSPSNGQVLSWNGTNFTWITPTSSTGYVQGDGIAKMTVGTTAPTGPAIGDVWIQTS